MDFFEQIAREQVRAMILNNARREDLSQVFSQGEMRLLGRPHGGGAEHAARAEHGAYRGYAQQSGAQGCDHPRS